MSHEIAMYLTLAAVFIGYTALIYFAPTAIYGVWDWLKEQYAVVRIAVGLSAGIRRDIRRNVPPDPYSPGDGHYGRRHAHVVGSMTEEDIALLTGAIDSEWANAEWTQ